MKELKRTLSILGSAECIIDSNGYVAAWQIIINDPFNKLDQSCTETIGNCIESLRLLHACPIIDKLEFSTIINCCVRAKQLHLAAALLPIVVQNKDKDFIITVNVIDNYKHIFLLLFQNEKLFFFFLTYIFYFRNLFEARN